MNNILTLQNYLRDQKELFYEKRSPRETPALSMHESILSQVEKKDVLLSYPFESMKPFIKMLNDAAEDPDVVSIKMTLYRVADRSKIIDALIEAAENGKEVVVLVELRARFDEANNIEMSHRLEDAGCQILYGLGDYKVHSKLCLITQKKGDSYAYITQIGTGNYNEKTSRLCIRYIFDTIMKDDEKGKEQNAEGIYEDRHINEEPVNSQEIFFQDAYDACNNK